MLCGRCKDGLALSLRPTECIDCSGTGAFLGLSIIAVFILTVLIIYFNPNIPTDLRGILFYVQVLPFLFKPNDRVGDVVTTVSGMADLGRPTEYPFDTCAVPALGNLGTMALNYVTPAEVLVILIVLFTIRRFLHFKREKPFQCFFVLIVLMYKYIVETSFGIIHCVDVGGMFTFLILFYLCNSNSISTGTSMYFWTVMHIDIRFHFLVSLRRIERFESFPYALLLVQYQCNTSKNDTTRCLSMAYPLGITYNWTFTLRTNSDHCASKIVISFRCFGICLHKDSKPSLV